MTMWRTWYAASAAMLERGSASVGVPVSIEHPALQARETVSMFELINASPLPPWRGSGGGSCHDGTVWARADLRDRSVRAIMGRVPLVQSVVSRRVVRGGKPAPLCAAATMNRAPIRAFRHSRSNSVTDAHLL